MIKLKKEIHWRLIMESGILYVVFNKWICDPETKEMPYKIGITRNSVQDRYYGLGLKMPGKFETLFAYKMKDYAKAEQSIQSILNKNCVNGEWFRLNQKDIDLIKQICERMDGILITEEIENEIENETETESQEYYSNAGSDNSDDKIIDKKEKYNINYGGEIDFRPDKNTFRKNLLKVHQANHTIIYSDGREKKYVWNANNVSNTSSIINNIRSGPLRDWKDKGIIKAIFEVKI
jgi:hypothetical protein